MAIARLQLAALDCPDPLALAEFYSAITGWAVRPPSSDDSGWVQLVSDAGVTLAFQRVDDYRAPEWPGQGMPQQAHLDFAVEDLAEGERALGRLGISRHAVQPEPEAFLVFLDPAGHPFCLVRE
ncbi:MAG: VOC family protein [Actinomycetota bacterium]